MRTKTFILRPAEGGGDNILRGILGEPVSTGQPVYQNAADGKWYLAQALEDGSKTFNLSVCSSGGGADDNAIFFRYGTLIGLEGLPENTNLYLSQDVPGVLTDFKYTYGLIVPIGVSKGTTDIDVAVGYGSNDYFTTGATLENKTLIFNRNDSLSAYTVDITHTHTDDEINLSNTGYTGYLSGATTQKDVNDILDEFDITYTGEAERTVGGITEGQSFTNASMVDMWDALIKQEKFPTLTNPSSTFTSNQTGFREVGATINITFNSNFSRGSISPQYSADSPFRSGLPNLFEFEGTGLTNQVKQDLTDSQSVNNYIVLINGQTWRGRVRYDGGVQPKSSYGNDFNSPLSPGNTSWVSRTITGVYPYFATTSSITVMTKQSLAAHGSQITLDLVLESGSDKQSIEVPEVWGSLSALAQWNPLSSSWDTINVNTFTETTITKEIQGNNISYRKYTHNGALIGARRLRLTF